MTPQEKEEVKVIVLEALTKTFDVFKEVHAHEIQATEELFRSAVTSSLFRAQVRDYIRGYLNEAFGDYTIIPVLQQWRDKLP